MKKIDIISAANILAGIPLNKIKDDKVKFTAIADYRAIRKVAREIEDERNTVIEKLQKDFADEMETVRQLRSEGRVVSGHNDFLKAERDTNKILADMMQEEVSVPGLKTVSFEDFVKAVKDIELTMESVAALDGIVLK